MRRIASLLALLALLVAAPVALAARAPTTKERRAIAAAAKRSAETQGVRGQFKVRRIRVSTVDRRWARASLLPTRAHRGDFDAASAVFRRRGGRWALRTLGTAGTGCVVPRKAVRRDLRLDCIR